MSKPKTFVFSKSDTDTYEKILEIQSRGYKRAVKSFQLQHPKLTQVLVGWIKDGVELFKLQKLPLGRKKKLGK